MIKALYKIEYSKNKILLHNVIKINSLEGKSVKNKLIYIIDSESMQIAVALGISNKSIKILTDAILLDKDKYNELCEKCNEINTLVETEENIICKNILIKIESIIDYIGLACALSNENILFRGQANIKWDLKPSIFRNDNKDEKENKLYKDIKQWNNDLFSSNSYIRDLCNMQHYGIPTRLIDWTSNPLHALYFATIDETVKKKDAQIIIVKVDCVYDDDSKEYTLIDEYFSNRFIEDKKVNLELIDILNQKGDNYFFIKTKYYNKRIKSQQGYFSIYIDISNNEVENIKKNISENISREIINAARMEMRNNITTSNNLDEFKNIRRIIEERAFRDEKISKILEYYKHLGHNEDNNNFKNKIENIFNEGKFSIIEKLCAKKHNMNEILENESRINIIISKDLKEELANQLNIMGVNSRVIYPDEQGLAMYMREKYI